MNSNDRVHYSIRGNNTAIEKKSTGEKNALDGGFACTIYCTYKEKTIAAMNMKRLK